ncbi:D-aminoacyl-tRNA deacylase [Mariniblastus sp.]|jgi:D-tyrosyl-tRNA(Tyr) deacylase|nr:D-aminoacyl-tRNA deacylase [Mariniblastus sp.]MDB4481219.1 D-aminoacyl-tRNA deacylase [bacterium]MDA7906113.1 D-aminoacyl-tRNA deacylase [Mariniblastus sp.]MDA7923775.1 D-aminoacyl-tRNA deacylase [Mariniblastus sp.]MDA7925424.1 D-aminoacyl-tRNA deacylase [Mariniblastus sp.]
MRAVVQRVTRASVAVEGETVGRIDCGLLVFLGVEVGDEKVDLDYLVGKITGLRIFEDAERKMNRSLLDTQGSLLVISQFTLLGNVKKGKRPSFVRAAKPALARRLYQEFIESCRLLSVPVQTGIFQAEMAVELVNDGPVTILLDSRKQF